MYCDWDDADRTLSSANRSPTFLWARPKKEISIEMQCDYVWPDWGDGDGVRDVGCAMRRTGVRVLFVIFIKRYYSLNIYYNS